MVPHRSPSCDPPISHAWLTDHLSPMGAMWLQPFPTRAAEPSVLILAVGLESRTAGPSQRALAQAFSHPGKGSPGCLSSGHEPVARREVTRCPLGSTEGVGCEFPPVPRPQMGCSCLDPWASWAKGAVVLEDRSLGVIKTASLQTSAY